MSHVALVACVKTKADRPVPARDLYVSPWFRMARAYAERRSDRWFILGDYPLDTRTSYGEFTFRANHREMSNAMFDLLIAAA